LKILENRDGGYGKNDNNLRNTRNWSIKKVLVEKKKRNILNRPPIKRERRRIVFGVPHDEAWNYAVFQSSAKFNKSISVITRSKTERKKFAKNKIREKGKRYDQKKKEQLFT